MKVLSFSILPALVAASLLLVACSRQPDPDYQKNAKAFVAKVEKAVAAGDPVKFNELCTRPETNTLFKLFTLFGSLYDQADPERPVVSLAPAEFSPAEVDKGTVTEVKVKVALLYNGKLRTPDGLDKDIGNTATQLINLGLPTDMDLWLVYEKGNFKLKDYGFSPLYTLALKAMEALL
jgi:hypothetical protein